MQTFEWVPPRAETLPDTVARQTLRAWDRAVVAFRREYRRRPTRAVVYWDGVKKVARVEVA